MAKVGLTKLGLKPNNEIKIFEFNEQSIEVKQYLPVEEKLALISDVLTQSHDANNFSNPVKVSVFTLLEIIEKYTNVNFTEKQKENVCKLYDMLVGNGFAAEVIENIPKAEYEAILEGIQQTIESVYKYQNSILGILDSISQDYSNINLDIDGIKDKLTNPDQIATLKDLAKMSGFIE